MCAGRESENEATHPTYAVPMVGLNIPHYELEGSDKGTVMLSLLANIIIGRSVCQQILWCMERYEGYADFL